MDAPVGAPQRANANSNATRQPDRNRDMTKSVLSQATGLQSGSAVALGALMAKGSGRKNVAAPGDPSVASGARQPDRNPDSAKSVLPQAPGLRNGALGGSHHPGDP